MVKFNIILSLLSVSMRARSQFSQKLPFNLDAVDSSQSDLRHNVDTENLELQTATSFSKDTSTSKVEPETTTPTDPKTIEPLLETTPSVLQTTTLSLITETNVPQKQETTQELESKSELSPTAFVVISCSVFFLVAIVYVFD